MVSRSLGALDEESKKLKRKAPRGKRALNQARKCIIGSNRLQKGQRWQRACANQ